LAAADYRVLLDKDGVLRSLPALAELAATAPPPPLPTEAAFLNQISDFWYHALWAARKLRRGELLVAKQCCDSYLTSSPH
jgi:aminoglycoside 6-adenylyltransferase